MTLVLLCTRNCRKQIIQYRNDNILFRIKIYHLIIDYLCRIGPNTLQHVLPRLQTTVYFKRGVQPKCGVQMTKCEVQNGKMRSPTLLKYEIIDVFCVKNTPLSIKMSAFGGLRSRYTSYRVRQQTPYLWASHLDPTGTSVPQIPSFVEFKKSLNYTMLQTIRS